MALSFLFLPEKNFYKFWWDEELNALKDASIKSNKLWKEAGKPRHGPIFNKRQLCRTQYRKAVRDGEKCSTTSYTNDLHETLLTKDGPTFWKCWPSKFETRAIPTRVGGCVDPNAIAKYFCKLFF